MLACESDFEKKKLQLYTVIIEAQINNPNYSFNCVKTQFNLFSIQPNNRKYKNA